MTVAISLASCEKIIEFEGNQDASLAIFALTTPEEPFSMMVSRSFTINDNPSHVFTVDKYYDDLDSLYQTQIAIKDAEAQIIVNGTETHILTYNEKRPYNYTCDYRPQVGDNIEIKVSAQGYKDATATTQVKAPIK